MRLEKIITLANQNVRLLFLAMERSLRSAGCGLPIWVIPYDKNLFDLPANATWWELPDVRKLLADNRAHPMMAKYQCFTTENYQFVDTDVIFLRNPQQVLADHHGFITSCGYWRDPLETCSPSSLKILQKMSSGWQTRVFCAGQFACDRALYNFEQLRDKCLDPRFTDTCLTFPWHDQPGLVLLTNLSGVPIYNLTLPPVNMESSWAGDYPERNYIDYWTDENRKPYLIHWAGCDITVGRPIDQLFIRYFTDKERSLWDEHVAEVRQQKIRRSRSLRGRLRKVLNASKAFVSEIRK